MTYEAVQGAAANSSDIEFYKTCMAGFYAPPEVADKCLACLPGASDGQLVAERGRRLSEAAS